METGRSSEVEREAWRGAKRKLSINKAYGLDGIKDIWLRQWAWYSVNPDPEGEDTYDMSPLVQKWVDGQLSKLESKGWISDVNGHIQSKANGVIKASCDYINGFDTDLM